MSGFARLHSLENADFYVNRELCQHWFLDSFPRVDFLRKWMQELASVSPVSNQIVVSKMYVTYSNLISSRADCLMEDIHGSKMFSYLVLPLVLFSSLSKGTWGLVNFSLGKPI